MGRIVCRYLGALAAVALPATALAQVDCARSPTFMRKIPGGQEIVFHPGCEPPALTPKPGKKTPTMAPVSPPVEANPVPIAGARASTVALTPASADASAAQKPEAAIARGNQTTRVRVQAYTRTRRR